MLKTKVMSKKPTILTIERKSDLLEFLYILKNEDNTFIDIDNEFLEVLCPILRYYYAQNHGYVEKKTILRIER